MLPACSQSEEGHWGDERRAPNSWVWCPAWCIWGASGALCSVAVQCSCLGMGNHPMLCQLTERFADPHTSLLRSGTIVVILVPGFKPTYWKRGMFKLADPPAYVASNVGSCTAVWPAAQQQCDWHVANRGLQLQKETMQWEQASV